MNENDLDNEFISIDKILEDTPNDNTIMNFSNFNDVIKEDYINTSSDENTENNYFYQPQFKNYDNKNICEFKIVGYNDSGKKPDIKMGEFELLNDKWLIISHLYNVIELDNVYALKKNFFDIFSIVLNKNNVDMILSLRYIINKNLEKYKFSGKFIIIYRYKKLNKEEELIELKEIDDFPGFNKSLEFLIKELSHPNIIENYEW